jgi:centrosomal protein CEP41
LHPDLRKYVVILLIIIIKKNQEGTLIIITHIDEKHGIPSATIFAEKGFDNVYLLSGGVEAFL